MNNEVQERARQNRQRSQETKAALYEEKAAANHAARLALERVCENPEATNEEILRAAEILAKLAASSCILH